MSRILRLIGNLRLIAAGVFVAVFGQWRWTAPRWLGFITGLAARGWRSLIATRVRQLVTLGAVLAMAGTLIWLLTRPVPHYVTYTVHEPALTTYNERGVAVIDHVAITFSEPVARLEQIEKPVTAGITVTPAVAGTWFWIDDKQLRFTPANDWPVDEEFSVRLARNGLFADRIRLELYTTGFRTAPFSATIRESQFYQDPVNPALKKLVATVGFSHPVDGAELEPRVSLLVAKDAAYLGLTPDSRHVTITYDKLRLSAFVHSAALPMPNDDTPITLQIDKGVRASRGGNATDKVLTAVVTVPGRASLRFASARMAVVDNARYEPEQILFLNSSSPVGERAFAGKMSVRLLPERHPRQPESDPDPYRWVDAGEIGLDILNTSPLVDASYVPAEEGGNTAHGFRFRAPVARYVHVTVQDGVQGIGGYFSARPFVATVKVEPYRQALTFLGEGALLSLSGDRKIGFLVRDVKQVEVEIGRVLPNQLHHLAPYLWDFARPSIDDYVEDKLVERVTTRRDYDELIPGKPTYDSIDLGAYLTDRTGNQQGFFMLRVRSAEPGAYGAVEDTRFVLVTDLGFIVKMATDTSRDVFVQSIRSGLAVAGAHVELRSANGQAVFEALTDETGRARLPRTDDKLRSRDKAPLFVAVQKDGDVSFMPVNIHTRRLDFSRFDTGGVQNARSPQELATYLFSDRGIYRPGDTAHLGVISRTAEGNTPPAGVPIEVEITDPRGTTVSHALLKLSPAAFEEVEYTSQPSSPTGTYQVVAYLPRENRRREVLGSTSFRVQEFEPDRLKVQLQLSNRSVNGWVKPDEVRAQMTVAHLFGEPAGNRRVEGEMSLTSALPRFASHTDYRFQIGEGLIEPYRQDLAAVTTSADGTAELTLDLKRFIGRAYRLNVLGRAFEAEGGRNVAVQQSVIVSEAPYLVGVKPDGDLAFVPRGSVRGADWRAVNPQLTPVAADNLTLEWVHRRYVSVLTQQDNGMFKYVSRLREVVRDSRSVRIAANGTRFPLPTQEPGEFVLVLRDTAGAELNRLTYSVAGDANLSRSLERNTELQVQLDKPSYGAGDTIAVSIRAPYVGAGLITIERDRVFHYQWFKTSTTSSVQRITVPADFEGNGYVNVQFMRDPASRDIFTSPLSYGVAAFAPNLERFTQPITLAAPRNVKPGETLVMRVTAGQATRATVLAIDEGILQVARYRNPDPLAFFFQKRMLEVDTRQILDLILPEFKRLLSLAAPGGDGEGDSGYSRHLNPFNRKRKPPVAYWSGLVDVGPKGRELRYRVPDHFNGRLRIVAIGVSPQRIGVADTGTDVKGDFILTPNVPAMVSPGDEFVVSVGVFNNTVSGPVRLEAQLGPALSLQTAAAIDLQILEKREGVAEFRIKANPALGAATLTFIARRGPAETRIEESVSVRPAAALRTQLTLGRVEGSSARAPLTRELYAEQRKVEAAVSTIPLVWGQGLSAYLSHYEYSCTEQLTSKAMSALIFLSRPELGAIKNGGPQPLDETFNALRSRANESGGFGLWSSTPDTAEFATVYAAHFLVEARDRGQRVASDMLPGVNDWLTRFASTPASTLADARLRAYAVYLLVRQGIKPNAAIANVEQELTRRYPDAWHGDLAAAYLASAYRLMQRTADADRIIRDVPWAPQKREYGYEVYYSAVVHDAQLFYLLARHFPNRLKDASTTALESISKSVSGTQASSLSAAYTVLALDAYARSAAATDTLRISEVLKDGATRELSLPAGAIPKVALSQAASHVQFSSRGPLTAYYVLAETGFDRPSATLGTTLSSSKGRDQPVKELSEGVEILREFFDAGGAPVTRVTVGQEFFVRLRIRATRRDQEPQVAVVDLLPGGLEPVLEQRPPSDSTEPAADPAMMRRRAHARRLPIGLPNQSDWLPHHVDVREDRLVFYGDATRSTGTFVYRVRATNAGVFQTPPAFAEGMYNRTIVALGRTGTLEIVKP